VAAHRHRSCLSYETYLNELNDTRIVELLYTQPYAIKSAVKLTLSIPRYEFISEKKQMNTFFAINTLGFFLASMLLMLILSSFLSTPISRLINEIKSIEMSQNELHKLSENGHNEFSFLRKTMNMLLESIELNRKAYLTVRKSYMQH
jgi:methyl-accepting chemotaxis protein